MNAITSENKNKVTTKQQRFPLPSFIGHLSYVVYIFLQLDPSAAADRRIRRRKFVRRKSAGKITAPNFARRKSALSIPPAAEFFWHFIAFLHYALLIFMHFLRLQTSVVWFLSVFSEKLMCVCKNFKLLYTAYILNLIVSICLSCWPNLWCSGAFSAKFRSFRKNSAEPDISRKYGSVSRIF